MKQLKHSMERLKHANHFTKMFTCNNCGCTFFANEQEYTLTPITDSNTLSTEKYTIDCRNCKQKITITI
jgi:hypothetical protein